MLWLVTAFRPQHNDKVAIWQTEWYSDTWESRSRCTFLPQIQASIIFAQATCTYQWWSCQIKYLFTLPPDFYFEKKENKNFTPNREEIEVTPKQRKVYYGGNLSQQQYCHITSFLHLKVKWALIPQISLCLHTRNFPSLLQNMSYKSEKQPQSLVSNWDAVIAFSQYTVVCYCPVCRDGGQKRLLYSFSLMTDFNRNAWMDLQLAWINF